MREEVTCCRRWLGYMHAPENECGIFRLALKIPILPSSGEADCVTVDDVDRLGAEAQIGLFNLYNHIRDEGHAFLLVSGPVAPAQLKLRGDLVTRLGWGLVYQVHELTDEEKIKAMKSHAASRGLDLPQEVCDYLLRHGAARFAVIDGHT